MPDAPAKRVIVIGNTRKPRVPETVEKALVFLRRDAQVVAVDPDGTQDLHSVPADIVFVFGGDGAILRAVRQLGRNTVPICGINLGKLGFLATLTDSSLETDLRSIIHGDCSILRGMLLNCAVLRDGKTIFQNNAVNDAVISRGALSRLIPIDLFIDGLQVSTFNGDGLIISTPLGSTAHSLSAGGPIVEPDVASIILTPICPHTLSNRPVVIPPDSRIEMRIGDGPLGTALTVDGQVFQEIQKGDVVSVSRSEDVFLLVRSAGYNYYQTLREKLHWRGSLGPER